MPTLVNYDDGVRFYRTENKSSFIADPVTMKSAQKSSAVFITHGHSDHALTFPNAGIKVFSTAIASQLYSVLTGKKTQNASYIDYYSTGKTKEIEVKFYPAGHLLGAAQIVFFFDDTTILYTGDISTDTMLTVPSAEIPKEDIDIVITESTYGDPNLFFEKRNKIKLALFKWIIENIQKNIVPVINIGHLGPAQEIIAYLNTLLSVDIYCSERMSRLNEVYRQNNIDLQYSTFKKHDQDIDPANSVILLSRAKKKIPTFLSNYKYSRAIITGQSVRFSYSKFQKAFPFSMHANAVEILSYVKAIKPKKVYTLYGFDSQLSAFIRNQLKIPSQPLKLVNKNLSLIDFF